MYRECVETFASIPYASSHLYRAIRKNSCYYCISTVMFLHGLLYVFFEEPVRFALTLYLVLLLVWRGPAMVLGGALCTILLVDLRVIISIVV